MSTIETTKVYRREKELSRYLEIRVTYDNHFSSQTYVGVFDENGVQTEYTFEPKDLGPLINMLTEAYNSKG